MAYDFPNSPSVGQIYNGYIWDGEKWLTSGAPGPVVAYRKNYIINGAMMVSQENGSTAGTVNIWFPVDQFNTSFGYGGVASVAQVASVTPAGSPNRIRITVTTADAAVAAGDYYLLATNLEGLRVADLRFGSGAAKTITLQFGVKAPAGTYCVTFQNSAQNRAYVATYTISAGEANTDVVKSVTLTGDLSGTWLNDNGAGFRIFWCLMGGTTWQTAGGAWVGSGLFATASQFNLMGTVGNIFELFDVSLTEGTVAPPFTVPDYVSELALCMRYFEIGLQALRNEGWGSGTTLAYDCMQFKVVKRSTPAITYLGTWQYYNSGGAGVAFTPTTNGIFTTHFEYLASGLTNRVGWYNSGSYKANARL